MSLSQALTKDGMYGIVLPLGINTATARQVLCYIRQNGGNILDEDGNVALDSAKNRETLAFLKELYQYSPPGSANYGFGDLLTNYTAGTGAGTYYAGRMLGRVHSAAPDLEPVTGGIRQPHNGTPFCYTEPRGAYILAGARNRDAAKAWLLECLFERSRHIAWLLTSPGHNLPVRTSIAEDPEYKNFPLLAQHPDILATLLSETQFGGNFYKESPDHKPNLQGGALDTGPILPTMLQRYLINGESEEAALAWGQRQVTDLMQDA
jgi:multiple sugar transport system substrate-binding protein